MNTVHTESNYWKAREGEKTPKITLCARAKIFQWRLEWRIPKKLYIIEGGQREAAKACGMPCHLLAQTQIAMRTRECEFRNKSPLLLRRPEMFHYVLWHCNTVQGCYGKTKKYVKASQGKWEIRNKVHQIFIVNKTK